MENVRFAQVLLLRKVKTMKGNEVATEKKLTPAKRTKNFVRMSNPTKQDKFAVGVSKDHYWLITGIANGKNQTRSAVVHDIIEYYINHAFASKIKE